MDVRDCRIRDKNRRRAFAKTQQRAFPFVKRNRLRSTILRWFRDNVHRKLLLERARRHWANSDSRGSVRQHNQRQRKQSRKGIDPAHQFMALVEQFRHNVRSIVASGRGSL